MAHGVEDELRNQCRLAIANAGGVAWRNNNGALPDRRGIPVRFGLANDSAAINEVFKSSDLIGIYRGIFCAWEIKTPTWKWRGTKHEIAQKAYIEYVRAHGARGGFVTSTGDAIGIMLGQNLGAPHG
jgi:hypothetical protein